MSLTDTISGNSTGLSIAEEEKPKILKVIPAELPQVIWYTIEPNSYSGFAGALSTVARNPLNPTRQKDKGTTTDLDVAGGFNQDYTKTNFARLLQGFMFADVLEKFNTAPFNGTAIVITSIDGAGAFLAAAGLDDFAVGDLVLTTGNPTVANNAFGLVTAAAAGQVTTDIATVVDAAPAAASAVQVVGFEFDAADLTLTLGVNTFTLGATLKDLTELNVNVGEFLYVGGDDLSSQFAEPSAGAAATGYGRIKSISATEIVCDKATWTIVTDAGAGKSIRIFFDIFERNAIVSDDIVCRSYQLERSLGKDANGTQTQYLLGAFANELTINMPTADKLNADLGYVALDEKFQDGATGPKVGVRVAALGEEALNTSSDIVRAKMTVLSASELEPTGLFTYVQEMTMTINNNVTALKALGVIGGFSVNIGGFDAGGTATVYFVDVAALTAIRNNADVTIDAIVAKSNAGVVFDIPLLGLSTDGINVEANAPITVPLNQEAAKNSAGYTIGITHFRYLPTIAMPVAS